MTTLTFEQEPTVGGYFKLTHKEHSVGYLGINLGRDAADHPYAWTREAAHVVPDGILEGMGVGSTADEAFATLIEALAKETHDYEDKMAKWELTKQRLEHFVRDLKERENSYGKIGIDLFPR